MRKIHEICVYAVAFYERDHHFSELFNCRTARGEILEATPQFYSAFFFLFPALRKITLQENEHSDGDDPTPFVDALTTFLEKNRDKFDGGKAPEVD
jgi:hypothetical protein